MQRWLQTEPNRHRFWRVPDQQASKDSHVWLPRYSNVLPDLSWLRFARYSSKSRWADNNQARWKQWRLDSEKHPLSCAFRAYLQWQAVRRWDAHCPRQQSHSSTRHSCRNSVRCGERWFKQIYWNFVSWFCYKSRKNHTLRWKAPARSLGKTWVIETNPKKFCAAGGSALPQSRLTHKKLIQSWTACSSWESAQLNWHRKVLPLWRLTNNSPLHWRAKLVRHAWNPAHLERTGRSLHQNVGR